MGVINEVSCKVNYAMDEVDVSTETISKAAQPHIPKNDQENCKTIEREPVAAHIAINVDSDKPKYNHEHETEKYNLEFKHNSEIQEPPTACQNHAKCKHNTIVTLTIFTTVIIVTVLWYLFGWIYGLLAVGAAIVVNLLVTPGLRWFYIAAVTSKRDTTALWAYVKLLILIKQCERKNLSVGDLFQIIVEKQPEKFALISEKQTWTFRQLNEYSNRIANLFHNQGYGKGAVIGLLLENRVEFVGAWLGLSKLGIVTALINTNLRGSSLVHSIAVGKCSALIYGEEFCEAVEDIAKEISVKFYQINNEINKPVRQSAEDLTTLLTSVSYDKLPNTSQHPDHHDNLLYIYTSGTTGLPKAAVISHSRFIFIAAAIYHVLNFTSKDIYYNPLPLYHTAGGVMSIGQALLFGSTVVIRKKFSASGYFADCARYNCTIAQYIGEMARYILATPSTEYDRKHNIRMVFGNGLRPQIWLRFVERFNIPKVGEFYGATEGNANIMNNDNTVGAIGFVSRIIPQVYPISIIKADPFTGEPIRGDDGLCQRCKAGESGVFVGKIIDGNPSRQFLGYVDEKASAKKIAKDVFKKGDMAFLSGDLLTSDERGYLFFMDRTGDTFRWKGENVSTSEVEAQVSNVVNYKDSIVYGVAVPHTEGRAGMAAIYDPEREVDLDHFAKDIAKLLPSYAIPKFIRFLTEIELTGTCKLRKVDLQKEGYNPYIIKDALYYCTSLGSYELLTIDIYDKIIRGEVRF